MPRGLSHSCHGTTKHRLAHTYPTANAQLYDFGGRKREISTAWVKRHEFCLKQTTWRTKFLGKTCWTSFLSDSFWNTCHMLNHPMTWQLDHSFWFCSQVIMCYLALRSTESLFVGESCKATFSDTVANRNTLLQNNPVNSSCDLFLTPFQDNRVG